MKIGILDGDHDTLRALGCLSGLAGQKAENWNDRVGDVDVLSGRPVNAVNPQALQAPMP